MEDLVLELSPDLVKSGRLLAESLADDANLKFNLTLLQCSEYAQQIVRVLVVFPTSSPDQVDGAGVLLRQIVSFGRGVDSRCFHFRFGSDRFNFPVGHKIGPLAGRLPQAGYERRAVVLGVEPDVISRECTGQVGKRKVQIPWVVLLVRVRDLVLVEVEPHRYVARLRFKQSSEFGDVQHVRGKY